MDQSQADPSFPFLKRHEIESRAAELLRAVGMSSEPWTAFRIAQLHGIPVKLVEFENSTVAGKLLRSTDHAEIRVNRKDPYRRQNFTVAHELGHFILHPLRSWSDTRKTMYRRANWQDDSSTLRAEYQANLFAAALLMPEASVREQWDLFRSPHYLAPIFRVSMEAILRRLEELRLIAPTVPGIRYLDVSSLMTISPSPKPLPVIDERGPIPTFPPVRMDGNGRIITMSQEEQGARQSAMTRVLDLAGSPGREDPEGLLDDGDTADA